MAEKFVPAPISLDVEDQTKGGMYDDIDATIRNPTVKKDTFKPRKDGSPVLDKDGKEILPFTVVELTFDPEIEGAPIFTRTYTVGSKLRPGNDLSDDADFPEGTFLAAVDPQNPPKGVPENSKWGFFLRHLKSAGYNHKSPYLTGLDGLRVHVRNVDGPKFGDGGDRKSVLVPTSIVKEGYGATGPRTSPWPALGTTSTGTPTASSASTTGSADVENAAVEFILTELAETGKPLTRNELSAAARTKITHPKKTAIQTTLLKDSFLKSQQGWAFDGRQVSAA